MLFIYIYGYFNLSPLVAEWPCFAIIKFNAYNQHPTLCHAHITDINNHRWIAFNQSDLTTIEFDDIAEQCSRLFRRDIVAIIIAIVKMFCDF